jgi:hypothetical protein
MKKILSILEFLFTFFVVCTGFASATSNYVYGPALRGSYEAVTVSVTAATSATVKAVLASTSSRDLAVLKNVGPTYDLYWGEGASISTVNTWKKLAAGSETTIYTCNYTAPGSWGKTNCGIYIYVSPTPYTADVAQLRSYKLIR